MTPNPFTVLIVAATNAELAPLREALDEHTQHFGHDAGVAFRYFSTGVGGVATAASLTEALMAHPCDLVLNIGLGGALDTDLQLGDTFLIVSEEFGDLGAEDRDGRHLSLFALGLADADAAPFVAGRLPARMFTIARDAEGEAGTHKASRELQFFVDVLAERFGESLRKRGTTVAQAHGTPARIALFKAGNDAEVETMEGAAVFWVAFRQNVPCVQIRAVSNYVEPRDRATWQIGLAMENLTSTVLGLLLTLRERVRAAPVAPPAPSL